jgi:hypothetical protein
MTNAIGSTTNLTPDALMSYCQGQLDSIDGEIGTDMESDRNATQVSQALQSTIESFQQYSNGVNNDPSTCSTIETSLAGVITNMQNTDPGSSQLGPLIQTYNNMVWSGTGPTTTNPYIDEAQFAPVQSGPCGDNTLSSDEMSTYLSKMQGASSALDSGSDMAMIQIQSLMSERQTAISLTSNLVQSLGDQANTIAGNIGH